MSELIVFGWRFKQSGANHFFFEEWLAPEGCPVSCLFQSRRTRLWEGQGDGWVPSSTPEAAFRDSLLKDRDLMVQRLVNDRELLAKQLGSCLATQLDLRRINQAIEALDAR
jgi:hypothetical protein